MKSPTTYSLAQAARECALDPKTLAKRLAAAGIPTNGGRRFSLAEIVRGFSHRQELDEARTREQRAKADLAEMHRAQQMGTLGSLADLREIMADYWTRSRVAIESADFLSDTQKRKTSAMLNAIKLDESGS